MKMEMNGREGTRSVGWRARGLSTPYLLLLGRLLLVRRELVRRLDKDELALLDARLEGGPQRVLCEFDLRVRGLDELLGRGGAGRVDSGRW